MNTLPSQELLQLNENLRKSEFCMLTSVGEEGVPHTRPMYNLYFDSDRVFDGSLWFFTLASTHKVTEAANNPAVSVSIFDETTKTNIVCSGYCSLIRDEQIFEGQWRPELLTWFPHGVKEADLSLLHVVLNAVETWNAESGYFAHEVILGRVLSLEDPAKLAA